MTLRGFRRFKEGLDRFSIELVIKGHFIKMPLVIAHIDLIELLHIEPRIFHNNGRSRRAAAVFIENHLFNEIAGVSIDEIEARDIARAPKAIAKKGD